MHTVKWLFALFLWRINPFRLINTKSWSLIYIYQIFIIDEVIWFNGISTLDCYLGPNVTYTWFLSWWIVDNFLLKVKVPNRSYYLQINKGRIIGFIIFPKVSALFETYTALTRIRKACDRALMKYLICITVLLLFYIILCVNLLNMFIKHEFKMEMFVVICWSYGKWCITVVKSNYSTGSSLCGKDFGF